MEGLALDSQSSRPHRATGSGWMLYFASKAMFTRLYRPQDLSLIPEITRKDLHFFTSIKFTKHQKTARLDQATIAVICLHQAKITDLIMESTLNDRATFVFSLHPGSIDAFPTRHIYCIHLACRARQLWNRIRAGGDIGAKVPPPALPRDEMRV